MPTEEPPTEEEQTLLATGMGPASETGARPPMPESSGRFIGPYEVIRPLGRGGFGTVYLAEQKSPVRRQVAVKVLNPGMDFAEIRARFAAERETLNLMKHPGIAMLLDAGVTEDDQPYFVMEYVVGTPLHEFLAQRELPLGERLRLFRSICDAVQHAHNKGVIHRDLTANNVLVVDVDGRPTPKVIDFGIAKSLGAGLADTALMTSDGQIMGTPAYMSPEQARGDIDLIDTRTDIYTLGVQLYLILTGTLPLTEERRRELGVHVFKAICEEEPEPPSKRVARAGGATANALRGDLDWITAKALAKERRERYASVAELSEDVRRFLEHEPVLAGPPSTWYRLRKGIRRYRAAVTAAAGILLTLIAGLAVSIHLYLRSAANAAEARSNLDRFNKLSNIAQLENLRAEAAELGPARPENRARLQGWLDRAEALIARLPELHAVLGRSPAGAESEDERGADAFLRAELGQFVGELEAFATAPDSLLASVRARRAWADEVERRTLAEPAAAWERAADGVAADPRFGGLALRPQMGLVPLGPDPGSGLEEFVLLQSGEPPVRDAATGALALREESGIVLVLLPGGDFELGAQRWEPDAPRYDATARTDQTWKEYVDDAWVRRLLPVRLAPFFMSKYELTQAQWSRMTLGERPSLTAGPDYEAHGVTLLNPVDSVGWTRCRDVLAEYDLQLPTEAQWEYACRAGTDDPWHTGPDEASLDGYANLADLSARQLNWDNLEDAFIDDGYPYTSPVGRFLPNGFGLHDVHGNVYEWCLEPLGPYEPGRISGPDAYRAADDEDIHVLRGGCFRERASMATSSRRWRAAADVASPNLGVRPARAVEQ